MASSNFRIRYTTLSLGASVDQQTGNLSVFDILEEVRTPQVPIQIQSLVISMVAEKAEATPFEGRMLIHFLTPDGKQHQVGSGELKVPPEQRRMKAVFRFGGFPIASFGSHRLVLSAMNPAGQKVAESILDFDVVQVTQVAQAMAPQDTKGSVQH